MKADEHDPPTLELDHTLCKIHSMGLLLTQAALDEGVEPDLLCLADLGRVITEQADHGLEILFEVQAEIRAKKSNHLVSLEENSTLPPDEPMEYPSHENSNSHLFPVTRLIFSGFRRVSNYLRSFAIPCTAFRESTSLVS